MSVECNCGSWDRGDLRAILFMAACPVHAGRLFGEPKPEPPKPKRCGDCSFWMKSSDCPEERNVNGWNKGPSMNGIPCVKFQDTASPRPAKASKQGGGR